MSQPHCALSVCLKHKSTCVACHTTMRMRVPTPLQLVRRSPLRSDYFLPSDALRLSNVLEYTPGEDRLAAALQQTDKFSESEVRWRAAAGSTCIACLLQCDQLPCRGSMYDGVWCMHVYVHPLPLPLPSSP